MAKDFYKFFVSVGSCLLVGFAGSFFTTNAIPTWYTTLQKPFFSPPNWIFAPVWIILYICMGIAAAMVWQKGLHKKAVKFALKLFLIQLVINFFWSIIFFGYRLPGLALGEIILLWIAIFLTIKAFFPINKFAAYLLIPYLAWVSFATILNLAIVILNQ